MRRQSAYRWDRNVVRPSPLWVLFFTLLLSSCDGPHEGYAERLPADMKELCEKDAGARIYERVNDVEGYAVLPRDQSFKLEDIARGAASGIDDTGDCFPCIGELALEGYGYVETYFIEWRDRKWNVARAEMPWASRMDPHRYVRKTGLYRYRIAERSEGVCDVFDRIRVAAERDFEKRKDKRHIADVYLGAFHRFWREAELEIGDRCIVAEPISEFTAPFKIVSTRLEIPRSWWTLPRGRIVQSRLAIVDREDERILAESINYLHMVREEVTNRCGDYLKSLPEILIPTRKREDGGAP